jgi:hypothetical protein
MKLSVYKILTAMSLMLGAAAFDFVVAQSVSIDAPTPVSASTIRGKIAARDIGDPRPTAHYYVFEAAAGDVFLKIESSNLEGEIDVFYADNLRPVTRINLYADGSLLSTSREVYLRKAEKLILRIEAKTPTDDPGTYAIKFEGSWIAMAPAKDTGTPELPKATGSSDAGVKVNSVGTIVEVKPKPTPTPRATTTAAVKATETVQTPAAVSTVPKPKSTNSAKSVDSRPKLVVTDDLAKSEEVKPKESAAKSKTTTKPQPKTSPKATAKTAKKLPVETPKTETPKPDPAAELAEKLESLRLIVEFTDGRKIERPMNKVVRFGVDKGILTIVSTEGSIGRYSIVDVLKISIE